MTRCGRRTTTSRRPKAEAKLTRLVTELIDTRTEAWSERFLEDTVQEQMKKIVAGKKPRRGKATEPESGAGGGNVVSIMDALKRSVVGDKGKGKSKPGTVADGIARLAPGREINACLSEGRGRRGSRPRGRVLATRAGALATVKCAGPISGPSSSQASGIDTGARAGAGAVGDDRGVVAAVAQVVEQDAAGALRLGDRRDVAVGILGRHRPGHRRGEALDLVPAGSVGRLQRRDDVQPLAAGGLDEAGEAGVLETGANGVRAASAPRSRHALTGIKVHHDLIWVLQIVERRLPSVDLEPAALDEADQSGQAVDGDQRVFVVVERVAEG